MSRASTLALVAAGTIGVSGTASATPCTFILPPSVPINEVFISNPVSDCVEMIGNSVAAGPLGNSFTNTLNNVIGVAAPEAVGVDISAGSTLLGTFLNNGTIQGGTSGVRVLNSRLNAGFVNNGAILATSSSGTGVFINASPVSGGFTNTGRILGGTAVGAGVLITNTGVTGRTFSDGLTNSGTIQGGDQGLAMTGVGALAFSEGITNSGRILGEDFQGIFIGENVTFSGGIQNQATGIISSERNVGIYIDAITFSGGITNAGLIDGDAGTGIAISADNFNGGINNSGSIEALLQGIQINDTNFNGGINNSITGEIDSGNDGINVASSAVFSNSVTPAGINNSGFIRSLNNDGIDIEALTFWGGVTNSGLIDAGETGIAIGAGTTEVFHGGLTNSGRIIADNDGIDIYVQDFHGGVTNSGSLSYINAGTVGIRIDVDTFDGGVTNEGDIIADFTGISILANTFEGGVHNQASGEILASAGIHIVVDDIFRGGVHNAGIITASNGDAIDIDPDLFEGGVTNSGAITATNGTGIEIEADDLHGKIVNTITGSIVSNGTITTHGIYVDATNVHDGLENAGAITVSGTSGSFTAILVEAATFAGGLTNSGIINALDDTGIRLNIAQTFTGGVTNTGTGVITSDDDAIHVEVDATFSGGITNAGKLDAGEDGIRTDGNVFNGGIHNLAGAQILAGDTGIDIDNTTFSGGIVNQGLIDSFGSKGIDIEVTNFAGGSPGITNSGIIRSATGTGIEVDATTFTDGITNSGTIEGNGGRGVNIEVAIFGGGLSNNGGKIFGTGDGIYLGNAIVPSDFNDGVTNSGTIHGNDDGVEIFTTNFNGDFINSASGGISGGDTGVFFNGKNVNGSFTNAGRIFGNDTGVYVEVETWDGSFTNSGSIGAINSTGVEIDVDTFTGSFTNTGTGRITSANHKGVQIEVDDFEGGFTNAGLIQAGKTAGVYFTSTEMSGNFVNSGSITTGTETAVYLSGTVIAGYLTNSGLIQSATSDGILLTGSHVSEGIFNSGTILADGYAIDLGGANARHDITQTAGVMVGNINLDNSYIDILNLNGGSLDGDIVGGENGEDTVNVNAAGAAAQGTGGSAVATGTFAYLRGTIENVEFFNVNSGTAVLGSHLVGVNGDGITTGGEEGIDFMNVNAGGTVYLDDSTELLVEETYTQLPGGEIQFLLSLDPNDPDFEESGEIEVDGTANINGTITGVVDLAAFAINGGTTNFFTYSDVITAGTLVGNFANQGVYNNLIFFDIFVDDEDGDTVDIYLERIDFAEALAPASQSDNQVAVGGVLDTIFANGPSPEFADAFQSLLGASTYAEALAVYDQLLGAEHAQTSLASLNAMFQFQGLLGERMDVLHNGMGSAQWAMIGQPNDQLAQAETVLSDASPSPAMGGGSLVTTRDGNTLSMWGGVHGNWTSVEGDTNGPGFDQDTFGLTAGVDYAISSESIFGLAGSYMNSDLEFDSANSGDVDTFAVGLFGTFGLGGGYLDANANVGFHDVSSSRVTAALAPAEIASANYDATSWSLAGEVGTVIPVGRAYVAPMLSLTYTGLSVDSFEEVGSPGFNLLVASADTDSIATVLGARAGDYFKVGKATVNLQGNLGWRHEFGDDVASFSGAFSEDPSLLFNVNGSQIAEDSAVFGVGSTVSLSTRFEVFLNYDGVWNAEANGHNAALGLRANW